MEYFTLNGKKTKYSEHTGENMYDLLDRTFVIPQSYSYNAYSVTENYIARPDLISYDAYGDTRYADVICKLNGVSNPFELNENMVLIIPTPDCISDFLAHPEKTEDYDDNWGNDSNISNSSNTGKILDNKDKNINKRVNDAINGDVGYIIDTRGRVVIY
jgi:hypothetical protein